MTMNTGLPRLKEVCPKCGKKVHHLRKHLRRNHGIQPVADPSQTTISEQPIIENTTPEFNPEVDVLGEKVAQEEARFGVIAPPKPATQSSLNDSEATQFEQVSPNTNQTIFDPEATNYIVSTIFNTMATLTKEKEWVLDKEELEILGPPLNRVVNKHAPDFMKKYQDEVVLATVFASIFITKIQKVQAKKKGGPNNESRNEPSGKESKRDERGTRERASVVQPDDLKQFLEK